ncbi:FecCD family ABC transporter permease [Selenomonas artemidis]|uniref:FecCD family ABC transporter permease n=1 Tax=Selenomonas artemidis TaxID=671224 RepID=UPI00288A8183|nr:iron ABC transporter permease [Selenomonas artemidis]
MQKSNRLLWLSLTGGLIAVFFLSLAAGRYPLWPDEVAEIQMTALGGAPGADLDSTVVLELRLPRTLLAMLVGAGLSLSGAVYQGIFRNPLVSPDVLGVSSGAGFGAVLGILLWGTGGVTSLLAFACGTGSVWLAYYFSKSRGAVSMMSLVLSGIIISSIFSALISLVKYAADPYDKLPAITYWLMGSFAKADFDKLEIIGVPMIAAGALLLAMRWRINILSLGEEEARSLGIDPARLRNIAIVAATVITALSVTSCGIVGWVGLVIPHMCRRIVGVDHQRLLPATCFVGAIFLALVDICARSALAAELPIGILTALLGAPFFAVLLKRTREKMGDWS